MIKYANACKIAYEFYNETWSVSGLCDAKDLGEKWLFYPNSNEPFFGGSHIVISKADGSVEQFVLPDEENFKLLKHSVPVEIPDEFRV